MTLKNRFHSVLTALAIAVLVAACETSPLGSAKSAPPPDDLNPVAGSQPASAAPAAEGLEIAPTQRFSDVPLPAGLREDMDKTFVYESGTLAIGRMVYTSKESINDLAQFFVRECPAADWQLESFTQAGAVQLNFRKPGKRLDVTVRDLGGVTLGRELIILMTPEENPKETP